MTGPRTPAGAGRSARAGAATLPNLIVIGAMKCGTTAVHRYLGLHPEIAMAEPKELNFFIGPERVADPGAARWEAGNWHRGLDWYAARFRPAPVRGESSPGYTSPSFPEAAERMARTVPDARLVFLVRDPVERALSQYRHHRAEGTERRPPEEALIDPASQYVERGRYHARLQPYLDRFGPERIMVCAQEELLHDRAATLRRLFAFLEVDESFSSPEQERLWHVRRAAPVPIGRPLRERLAAELRADAARLRRALGRDFPGWSV